MGKSRRKPWVVDGYGSKGKVFSKNYANRRIRRTEKVIQDGMAYKRFTDPYDICDYKWYVGKDDENFIETPWKYNRK